jgi:hypothetical protein
MFGRGLICAIILCQTTTANAFECKYAGGTRDYRRSATITQAPNASFRVKLEIAARGCLGEFDGVGRMNGPNLVVRSDDKNDSCEIVISRQSGGISVQERDCQMWHGAACAFSGQLKARRGR